MVRTIQPVLEDLDVGIEEAAHSLGANLWQTFRRVLLPELLPAWVTGSTLAFARALGEYGSVVFIAGNMPLRTEITPLLIMTKLDQFDYAGASAIALALPLVLFNNRRLVNAMQRRRSSLPDILNRTTRNMATTTSSSLLAAPGLASHVRADPALVRWTLIAIGGLFLGLFFFLPLAAVFANALEKGVTTYFAALKEPEGGFRHPPDTLGLGNCRVFERRLLYSGRLADRQIRFRRQKHSPHFDRHSFQRFAGYLGDDLRSALWSTGSVRSLVAGARHQDCLRRAGHYTGHHICDLSLRCARACSKARCRRWAAKKRRRPSLSERWVG